MIAPSSASKACEKHTALKQGTEVVRVKVAPTGPNPRVHMSTYIACYPAFANLEMLPVEGVLRRILDYVAGLVAEFAPRVTGTP